MNYINLFFSAFGYLLIGINILGILLSTIPIFREAKINAVKKMGYHLWQEQTVTVLEIAVGIALVKMF